MRLGVIAPDAPPDPGGMQEHTRGLLAHFPADVQIELYARPGRGIQRPNIQIRDGLTGRFDLDFALLKSAKVDAWLTLNAGAAAFSRGLDAPVFAFVYGKDGLDPWYPSSGGIEKANKALGALGLPGGSFLHRRWRAQMIGDGLRRARHIFAISRFTKGVFENTFGIEPDKFTIIPPGIDERHLRPINANNGGPLRLLTVARLMANARRKNVDGVLEALASLKDELDFRYEVAGGGDDLGRLQAKAGELGIGDRVTFLGSISDEQLREAYGRADVFVLAVKPDPKDVEGFGMVYAEAAGAGVPSIAVAAGGVRDAVIDGETGILIDDAAPASIAHAIRIFKAERARYSPATIQDFARSITSTRTTALVWERIKALA